MATSDTELFESMALKNDQRAFQKIFDLYWEEMFHLALQKTKSPDLAQDLAQEVFISLWKYKHSIEIKTGLRNYLATMVKYGFFKLVQKNKQNITSLETNTYSEPSHEEHGFSIMEFNELYEKIEVITETLPPRCREIFIMNKVNHMSVEEIAQNFKISHSTVRNQLSKAREIFKDQLAEEFSLVALFFLYCN
ncbi:RNA polymerase sigma factor [Echinicola sediminis]